MCPINITEKQQTSDTLKLYMSAVHVRLYLCHRKIYKIHERIRRIMDLQFLFFTGTYRIIHVTVMSHSRDDYRRKELKLQKCCFIMF